MLWDCGSLNTGIGERLVPQALRELGVASVPTVIVTHAHIDHFAALPDVADALHVRRVLVPPQLTRFAERHPGSAPAEFIAALTKHAIKVETLGRGDTVDLAGLPARVLWPPAEREFHDTNDSSLVAMLPVPSTGAERRVLLTGDAAHEALANLLPSTGASPADSLGDSLKADILELPHHGAYIEPAAELVRVVDPLVVIQSTGPKRAADQRWIAPLHGRTWLATPRVGASWVEVRTDGTIASGSFR